MDTEGKGGGLNFDFEQIRIKDRGGYDDSKTSFSKLLWTGSSGGEDVIIGMSVNLARCTHRRLGFVSRGTFDEIGDPHWTGNNR